MRMVALCTPHHFYITYLTPLQLNTTMTVEDDLIAIDALDSNEDLYQKLAGKHKC